MDLTGLGSIFDFANGILKRVLPEKMSEAEKTQAMSSLIPLLEQRESDMLKNQTKIITAEINSSDKFVSRARPMVIYTGLGFIALLHVFLPILIVILSFAAPEVRIDELLDLKLPTEFWVSYGGIVSVYSIGRSAEKRGTVNKVISAITGNK